MTRRTCIILTTLFVMTLASGCEDSTGSGSSGTIVVTGHIQNNTQTTIPANTRLLAVWGVTAGTPDYSYVFGEGTIDRVKGTFRIEFDQAPPPEALNNGMLGVALLVATTNQSWHDGDILNGSTSVSEVVGLAGWYGVIFVHRTGAVVPGWVNAFGDGYSVGVGEKVPGAVFDIFKPTNRSSPILIIDDLANIEVVNWT